MINRGAGRLERLLDPVFVLVLWGLVGISSALKDYCAAASNLAAIGQRASTIENARRLLMRALQTAEAHGCREEVARASVSMAYVLLSDGDYEGAQKLLEPQLEIIRGVGDKRLLVETLLKLGAISDKAGDEPKAARHWSDAADMALSAHYRFGYAEAVSNLGGIAYRAHRDTEARDYWLSAMDAAKRRRDRLAMGELAMFLGIIAVRMEDVNEARTRFTESRSNFEKSGRVDLALKAASYLNDLDHLRSD